MTKKADDQLEELPGRGSRRGHERERRAVLYWGDGRFCVAPWPLPRAELVGQTPKGPMGSRHCRTAASQFYIAFGMDFDPTGTSGPGLPLRIFREGRAPRAGASSRLSRTKIPTLMFVNAGDGAVQEGISTGGSKSGRCDCEPARRK